jgi:hypothetical protein
MANSRRRRLVRDDEPSQKTDKGLEIPVPKQEAFLMVLPKRPSLLRHPLHGPDIIPNALLT